MKTFQIKKNSELPGAPNLVLKVFLPLHMIRVNGEVSTQAGPVFA